MKRGPFKIRNMEVAEHGFRDDTFRVVGNLDGHRVRKRFQSYEEAVSAKSALDIQSGNAEAGVRLIPSRLSDVRVAHAEFCLRLLDDKASLISAVQWYLGNYPPPAVESDLPSARADYLKSKAGHLNPRHLAEIRRQFTAFAGRFPGRSTGSFKRPEITGYL